MTSCLLCRLDPNDPLWTWVLVILNLCMAAIIINDGMKS